MIFFVPGILVSMATFPGIMVHESGHQLFCFLTKTKVHHVCYFQLRKPIGYVIHALPSNVWKHLLIGIGPLILNSGIGFLLGFTAVKMNPSFKDMSLFQFVLCYLAIAIGMHSFPSIGDARSIWKAIRGKGSSTLLRIIGVPLVGILCIGSMGSLIWLDLAYGVFISIVLPLQILT